MGLTTTDDNDVVRPCGFRTDGQPRVIKETSLIARMKNLCIMKNTQPKLAVCITMYNENESELLTTMEGVIQNYNAMYMDENLNMR